MFVQLLRTILIIVIVYYVARFLVRYFLPILTRYFIRKVSEDQFEQKETKKKEGEMHIQYKPEKHDIPDNLGEFVEYEEIDDKKSDEVN